MKQIVDGLVPVIKKKCYIHSTAAVIGDVTMGECVSVWPNAVVRGDENKITIGAYTNIQDLSVLHVLINRSLKVGSYVTVGHSAILHACEIGDNTLIGMGAIVLDGAKIGSNCIIGAGTVIPPNKDIPDNSLVLGNPYRIVRQTTEQDLKNNEASAVDYWELAVKYIKTANIL